MADRSNVGGSQTRRPLSTSNDRLVNSGRKSNLKNNISRAETSKDLLTREEEYRRLNEELEAKTASLVKEAEEVMKKQDSYFTRPSLLDNINAEDFTKDYDLEDDNLNEDKTARRSQSGLSSGRKISNRTPTQTRSQSRSKKLTDRSRPTSQAVTGDVDDEAFLTDFKEFSLQGAMTSIEARAEAGDVEIVDDVLPEDLGTSDLGTEATIRFLKAKLRVMQEELENLAEECKTKEEASHTVTTRLKEIEEEKNRYQRTSASQQVQIDKYKRLAEDAKEKSTSLENQLIGLRKELDQFQRTQKQQLTNHSAVEVRLNRALEEAEKYKLQVQKTKSQTKDTVDQDKRKIEQLMAENRRLEKQKNELMTGFKKQLKLIDILKRQKIHIEAAKMLSFSEEEFVKALEWGSN